MSHQEGPQNGPTYATTGSRNTVINKAWLKFPSAWIKFSECIVGAACFISACVAPHFVKHGGGGWIQFVSITGLLSTACICILYLFDNISRFPATVPWYQIEMLHSSLYCVLFLTAGILAAVRTSESKAYLPMYFDEKGAMTATTIFSFAGMVTYGAEAVISYFTYRQSNPMLSNVHIARSAGSITESPPFLDSTGRGGVSY